MSTQGIKAIWPVGRPLIGMVHLLPLPGAPAWGGSMESIVARAVTDAEALESAGFDGVIVENYSDVPFFGGSVPSETVASMTACVHAVRRSISLPVGVNVLRNDAHAAVAIAVATGARFIRVNVHTGSMWTDQGLIEGEAAKTLRTRGALGSGVAILADVHVKHGTPPAGARIEDAAADAWHRGRADGLVLSGTGTGRATDMDDVARVRENVPSATVMVGSGATPATVRGLLELAHGVIVGSAVMAGGEAGAGIDPTRAEKFIESAHS